MAAHKVTTWTVGFTILALGICPLLLRAEAPIAVPNSVAVKSFVPAQLPAQYPLQPQPAGPLGPPSPDGFTFGAGSGLLRGLPPQPVAQPQHTGPVPNLSSESGNSQSVISQFMSAISSALGGGGGDQATNPNDPWSGSNAFGAPDGSYGAPIFEKDYKEQLSRYPITQQEINQVGRNCSNGAKGFNCDPGAGGRTRLSCMVCNIYFEAANEPFQGQVAVGQSVMSRVFSGAYPDNVCKVVYQSDGRVAQYSWTLENKNHHLPCAGDKLNKVIVAAKKAFAEGSNKMTNYFNFHLVSPRWAHQGTCATTAHVIGNHRFCSINGLITRSVAEVARSEGLTPSQLGLANDGAATSGP